MMAQPLPMRIIARLESHLPAFMRVATPVSERRSRGGTVAAAVMPSIVLAIVQLVLHQTVLADLWFVWRPLLPDLTLVVAGATLVAAVAAGVHAWRHHA